MGQEMPRSGVSSKEMQMTERPLNGNFCGQPPPSRSFVTLCKTLLSKRIKAELSIGKGITFAVSMDGYSMCAVLILLLICYFSQQVL